MVVWESAAIAAVRVYDYKPLLRLVAPFTLMLPPGEELIKLIYEGYVVEVHESVTV